MVTADAKSGRAPAKHGPGTREETINRDRARLRSFAQGDLQCEDLYGGPPGETMGPYAEAGVFQPQRAAREVKSRKTFLACMTPARKT